ncbi:MAG: hypothetical protein GX796_10340 [Clostridiaceae bacterium]|jgi:hypothetical protein|nr:hypothetical protein [Clostridiaceae bacterium]
MGKVNEIPASPMDFLLFPIWVHKKLSVKVKGLIFAFLFVGVFDMFFYQNLYKEGFFEGNPGSLIFKIFLFVILSLLVGAIDVICTMVPISEMAIMIGKRSEKYVSARVPVILMKSYAVSHLLFVIPTAFFVYSGVDWNLVDVTSTTQVRLIFSILIIVLNFMPLFQLGVMYRTISIRTRIQIFGRLILIMTTYFWMRFSGATVMFFVTLFQDMLLK